MTPEWERDAYEAECGWWRQNPPAEMTEEEYADALAEHLTPPDDTPLPIFGDDELPF